MIILDKIGPMVEFCGTPQDTESGKEDFPNKRRKRIERIY